MRTAKSLIRLGGSPGSPESSLGAHDILLVLSFADSFISAALVYFYNWAGLGLSK